MICLCDETIIWRIGRAGRRPCTSGAPLAGAVHGAAHLPSAALSSSTPSSPPVNITPRYVPIGATVPMPARVLGDHHRVLRAARRAAVRAKASKLGTTGAPSGAPSKTLPTGHRPVPPWAPSHRRRPGVSFSDSALEHFHALTVPALGNRQHFAASDLWLVCDKIDYHPSITDVQASLAFCFARSASSFKVEMLGDRLFSTLVANQNLASFLVVRGRCRFGSTSFSLFPSLAWASAAAMRHGDAVEKTVDVTPTLLSSL